ncbi:hypothetical protein [Photobacterium satsumensis]|uniref:COG4648 family protein n=1 Tax=Photobacterium satsumensis TaxID=2910239 RepID=UPI003D111811
MRWLTAVTAAVLFTYPFAIYFGIRHWGLTAVAGLLIAIFALRFFLGSKLPLREQRYLALLTGGAGVVLAILGSVFREQGWLTIYPVVVNAAMLSVFATSLWQKQTLIERLARLQHPNLPPNGVKYTRNVTKVWCGYFVINGLIALATCFMPLSIWTLYNGLVSYLLAGLLFGGEWLVRRRIVIKERDCAH